MNNFLVVLPKPSPSLFPSPTLSFSFDPTSNSSRVISYFLALLASQQCDARTPEWSLETYSMKFFHKADPS